MEPTSFGQYRPPIPDPVKRAIRQRCGFGCVICGRPLYEYHHIEGYALTKEHANDEITLLCDNHHREVTNGLRKKEQIQAADKNPYNGKKGHSSPMHFPYEGGFVQFLLGDNVFTGKTNFCALMVDGLPLLSARFEDDNALLSVMLLDERNEPALVIEDNHLSYKVSAWDVEFVGKTLTVRDGPGRFRLRTVLDPPSNIAFDRGLICCNGIVVEITPSGSLHFNGPNRTFSQCNIAGVDIGIAIGALPAELAGPWAASIGFRPNDYRPSLQQNR